MDTLSATLYAIFLPLHSILRWLVVITAVFALGRALAGWLGKKTWTNLDDRAGLWFTAVLDSQMLVGLILYFFLSPITTAALQNFGGAMSNASIRYFAVEHLVMMLIGVALAHVGRSRARKAEQALSKHRITAILFGLALLFILIAIPWPFLSAGRPWIRFW